MSTPWEIPELEQLDSGGDLIRVPSEQNVPFTRRVRAVVDTREFQRLARVRQLGLVSLVYPGACHSRFEHALGVYHNALRYLRQLAADDRFARLIGTREAELLILAALLHDLGHWPFCHPIEDLHLAGMPPHETFAGHFLRPGTELGDVLRQVWGFEPEEVLDLLISPGRSSRNPSVEDRLVTPHSMTDPPERETEKALRLLRSILSGPIDIDKMDYLERDSLHAGVPYGRHFDKQRLIRSLVLNAEGDGLALSSKGKTAAELMVFARYVMFSEVYWHHTVRSATAMFGRSFDGLQHGFNWTELFESTDSEMIAALISAARGTKYEPLLAGVFGPTRSLYKRAAEYSHVQSAERYRALAHRPFAVSVEAAERLAEACAHHLGREVSSTEVLIDAPPQRREIEFQIQVYFPREDRYRELREVSPVVDALARTQFDEYVKRVRVFVPATLRDALPETSVWDRLVDDVLEQLPTAP